MSTKRISSFHALGNELPSLSSKEKATWAFLMGFLGGNKIIINHVYKADVNKPQSRRSLFDMNLEDISDILIEALEVFLNHILYLREVFPGQIFKKRRIYNTPVYVSIFPPLNTYLYKVLQTARELSRNRELQRIEVLFYRNELVFYEKYNFELSNIQESPACAELQYECKDRFLLSFEEQLRTALYTLAERVKHLEKLENDTKFKVLIHTTQAAFLRLTHNSNYQEFPWLLEQLRVEVNKKEIALLPLSSVDSVGLQISADVF